MTEALQDWLFHFNPYKQKWYAFKREQNSAYFNGELKDEEMIHGTDVIAMMKFISKNID